LDHAICPSVQVMSLADMNEVFSQQRQVARLAMSSDTVKAAAHCKGPVA
jgi:hypothetical protein